MSATVTQAQSSESTSRAAAARPRNPSKKETTQAKSVALGRSGDAFEREADSVAEQVVSGKPATGISSLPSGGLAQSQEEEPAQAKEEEEPVQAMEEEEPVQTMEEEEPVQTKASARISREQKRAAAARAIHGRGPGKPLAPSVRKALESSLGVDLSAVRVHVDAATRQAVREMGARAFAHKNHVFLGPGESETDLKLIAHEVAHVVQQGAVSRRGAAPSAGGAVQQKEAAPASAAAEAAGEVAPDLVDLKGMATLQVPERTVEWLEGQKRRTGLVNVRFGSLAKGQVKMKKEGKRVEIAKPQAIPLEHELFARVGQVAPELQPSLVLRPTERGKLTGYVGLQAGTKVPSPSDFKSKLGKLPDLVGLPGFGLDRLSKLNNKLADGALEVGVTGARLAFSSIFDGTLSFTANDQAVTSFTGQVAVRAGGLAQGNLTLERNAEGLVTGEAEVGLDLPANFSGMVHVVWDGQAVSGEGKVGYQGEKLSGSVSLKLMEKEAVDKLEAERKPPPEAETQPKKKSKKSQEGFVVFGEGDLTFAFTDWLNGTAHVIVDPKGFVTIIGKITPQKEFELFEQQDYNKDLPPLEARAIYGLPVVGNVYIAARVTLGAFATLGPGKLYNIEANGTYSTDPEKSQDFTIQGTLNVSAAAGLRLRGEVEAGLTIVSHDVALGAGINGLAGVRGYAEATPIIGYREQPAAEGADKKGEFFIRGDVEIAAQPFLGLSGDMYVKLDAPWWSPISDKKWTWPLGGKEWPIGGDFGIGASVDYVFGSGKAPSVEMKEVDFSADKFLSDLYSDKAQAESKQAEKQGAWKEKNQKAAKPPPPKEAEAGMTPGKAPIPPPAKAKKPPKGKASKKKKDKPADPKAKTADGKSVRQHQEEATKKGPEKDTEKAYVEPLKQGLAALDQVTERYAKSGASEKELEAAVKSVRRKFKVFKTLTIFKEGQRWMYHYVVNPEDDHPGPPVASSPEPLPDPTAVIRPSDDVVVLKVPLPYRTVGDRKQRVNTLDHSLRRHHFRYIRHHKDAGEEHNSVLYKSVKESETLSDAVGVGKGMQQKMEQVLDNRAGDQDVSIEDNVPGGYDFNRRHYKVDAAKIYPLKPDHFYVSSGSNKVLGPVGKEPWNAARHLSRVDEKYSSAKNLRDVIVEFDVLDRSDRAKLPIEDSFLKAIREVDKSQRAAVVVCSELGPDVLEAVEFHLKDEALKRQMREDFVIEALMSFKKWKDVDRTELGLTKSFFENVKTRFFKSFNAINEKAGEAGASQSDLEAAGSQGDMLSLGQARVMIEDMKAKGFLVEQEGLWKSGKKA